MPAWVWAVANAAPEVRAEADFVTASNEEDGVALGIERFVLRRRLLIVSHTAPCPIHSHIAKLRKVPPPKKYAPRLLMMAAGGHVVSFTDNQ